MSGIEDALRKLEAQRLAEQAPRQSAAIGTVGGRGHSQPAPFSLDAIKNVIQIEERAVSRWGPISLSGEDERSRREFGHVKRPIIAQAQGKTAAPSPDSNIVMIASAVPGEGKSVTAMNLALSLAREKDLSVLLIDADLVKPDISRLFGVQNSTGLTDFIADDDLQFADVACRTSLPNLYFMSAGNCRADATELLNSKRMEYIVGALASDLSNVITVIDSSPLLLTTESRIIATLAGQIVLVVRAEKTPRLVVAEALDCLDQEKKPIGLVLNGASGSESSYYAGAYSSYANSGSVKAESARVGASKSA